MRAKKQKASEPSLRDKLSEKFDADLLADYEANGATAIAEARAKAPEKYLDTVSRRIAAVEPKTDSFEGCKTREDVGRVLLKSVGFHDPDDDSIQAAIELNERLIDDLQAIKARAEGAIQ